VPVLPPSPLRLALSLMLLWGCTADTPSEAPGPAIAPVGQADTPQQRAEALIAASPFNDHAAPLAASLGLHVTLVPTRTPMDSVPTGASRLAGWPDVPAGFEWPVFGEEPMALLAQIDLADVKTHAPDSGLPDSGWLYFFWAMEKGSWGYESEDTDTFAVRYHEGPVEGLTRAAPPPGLPELALALEPCKLAFEPGVSLPDWRDLRYPKDMDLEGQLEAWYELSVRVMGQEPPRGTLHHLLGHAQLVQGDSRGAAATHRGGEKADWNLLLQLETDEPGPNWMWGDAGTVYFLLRDEDLEARRFDQAWLVAQSY